MTTTADDELAFAGPGALVAMVCRKEVHPARTGGVPAHPGGGGWLDLSVSGALARTVSDSALLLETASTARILAQWDDVDVLITPALVAKHGAEDLLYSLAAQIEAAAPWANRRPALPATT